MKKLNALLVASLFVLPALASADAGNGYYDQFLFQVIIDPEDGIGLELTPVRIERCRTRHANRRERTWLFERMRALGRASGVDWQVAEGRLVLAQ